MPSREEIINSLNACMDVHRSGIWSSGCAFCSYAKQSNPKCFMNLTKDVIALLQEQQETITSLQRTICKLNAALQEQPQWISVKDKLPDAAGYECLVCAVNENYNQTHVFTAHTGYGEPGWWTGNVHYMSRITSPSDNRLHPALNVTHWMPLPEPPEEVKKDE